MMLNQIDLASAEAGEIHQKSKADESRRTKCSTLCTSSMKNIARTAI